MFLQNYTYIMIKTDISIAARTTEGIYLIFLFNIAQKSEQNLKSTDERRETRSELNRELMQGGNFGIILRFGGEDN